MTVAGAYIEPIVAQLRRLGESGDGATAGQESGLYGVHTKLTELHTQHTTATRSVMSGWRGTGAGEANSRAAGLHGAVDTIAGNAQSTLGTLRDATGRVSAGRTEIQGMIDHFAGWAAAQLEVMRQVPEPIRPAIGAGIWEKANEYAGRAGEVVSRVNGELSDLAGALRGLDEADTVPLGEMGAPLTEPLTPGPGEPSSTGSASASGTDVQAPPGSGSPGGSGGGAGGGGGGISAAAPNLPPVQPFQPGSGVMVDLPGGGQAEAPNEAAAAAVFYALQQLGVPYVWGASNPGQGFDCSGLTSWAYEMAGMEIPRHSSAQAIGAAVPPDQLMPGDLVVWDGHVAMVIGDGMMVEAGDPVQVSSIRTTNSGMPFLGFYRPTG